MRIKRQHELPGRRIAMKMRLPTLPVALLVLVMTAAAVARPLDGRSQGVIMRLSAAKFRIGGWSSAQNQAAPQVVMTVVYTGLQRTGTITGQVVLPSGQQVANRIRITLSGYRISSLIGYTDNKGRFLFPNIGDGTYTLEVEGDQNLYEPVTQEVRVTYGAHPVLVITLREKRQPVAKSNSNVVFAGELDQQVPDEARKEFEKGAELSEKGKFQDAVKCFKNAVAIFPT